MDINGFLHFFWEYVIVFFIFKMVVLKGLANIILKRFMNITQDNERRQIIWQHWQLNRAGAGHEADTVAECRQDNCLTFQPTV